jgi:organic hydroperoxide reductase OsmC/OhrA
LHHHTQRQPLVLGGMSACFQGKLLAVQQPAELLPFSF